MPLKVAFHTLIVHTITILLDDVIARLTYIKVYSQSFGMPNRAAQLTFQQMYQNVLLHRRQILIQLTNQLCYRHLCRQHLF